MTAWGCDIFSENSGVPKRSVGVIISSRPNKTSRAMLLEGKKGKRPTLLVALSSIIYLRCAPIPWWLRIMWLLSLSWWSAYCKNRSNFSQLDVPQHIFPKLPSIPTSGLDAMCSTEPWHLCRSVPSHLEESRASQALKAWSLLINSPGIVDCLLTSTGILQYHRQYFCRYLTILSWFEVNLKIIKNLRLLWLFLQGFFWCLT